MSTTTNVAQVKLNVMTKAQYEAATKVATELYAVTDGGAVDEIIEFQQPTSSNNYTWYRKYKSGWVEQGGIAYPASVAGGQTTVINLPITMNNSVYTVLLGFGDGDVNNTSIFCFYHTRTASSFKINTNLTTTSTGIGWQVSGVAAS